MKLIDWVIATHEKPSNYDWLSENPNITWEDVNTHPEKPWDYDWLSLSQHVRLRIFYALWRIFHNFNVKFGQICA